MSRRIPLILAGSALLAGCRSEDCDDSWLWRWDRAEDIRRCAESGDAGSQRHYGKLLALEGRRAEADRWLDRAVAAGGGQAALPLRGLTTAAAA